MPSRQYRLDRQLADHPLPKDTRHGGDRHKGKRKSGKQEGLSKWDRRKIVAWDGEGANLEGHLTAEGEYVNGTHVYNLLASSDGVRIFNPLGLSTIEVFDFFIKYGDPKAINVVYGGSYDVNMLLRDLPVDKLRTLWVEGSCFWMNYRIYYAPRKKFTLQKFIRTGNGKYKRVAFTLWDVLGFFQASFVVACRKWLGDLPILDEIERMKGERSVFSPERIDEIVEYNNHELELLVLLMQALFKSMDTASIRLVRYDGAGAIAAALFKQNSIIKHKGEPPPEVIDYARIAYSGGRIEAAKVGNYER